MVLWSGLAWMPRGRLPSGMVAMTCAVPVSMTVMSPDISLVTKSRGPVDRGTGAAAGTAAFLEQAANDTARAAKRMNLILGNGCFPLQRYWAVPDWRCGCWCCV